jgi:hypothetical protein
MDSTHPINVPTLYARRRDDLPLTEADLQAIGRAAHAELRRLLESKHAEREAARRQRLLNRATA